MSQENQEYYKQDVGDRRRHATKNSQFKSTSNYRNDEESNGPVQQHLLIFKRAHPGADAPL